MVPDLIVFAKGAGFSRSASANGSGGCQASGAGLERRENLG
jgi:hypothetical protein